MDNVQDQTISPAQQVLASCTGSIFTSLFVTPLDVIKIRMQAQAQPLKPGSAFIYHNGLMDYVCVCTQCVGTREYNCNNVIKCSAQTIADEPWFMRSAKKYSFSGPIDAMVKISRSEGITSLWSGLPPTLVMSIPATVMYYTAYDQIKFAFGFRDGETDPRKSFVPALAGVLARIGVTVCASPLELMRTKMQSESLTYSALGQAFRTSIRETGLGILMKGLGPHLLRDVPFSAIYWIVYENLKSYQMSGGGRSQTEPTFLQAFTAGAIGGTLAALATNPFDVIKTHRQIELGKIIDSNNEVPVTSTWKLVHKLYQQQGMTGLYAGIKPRVLRVSLACAIMISTYEYMKTFFRAYNAGPATYLPLGKVGEEIAPVLTLGEKMLEREGFDTPKHNKMPPPPASPSQQSKENGSNTNVQV